MISIKFQINQQKIYILPFIENTETVFYSVCMFCSKHCK